MARIRSVKPAFFRHEALQDLERAHPGAYVMLVFEGLWGHCDKHGVFQWRPRQLKLDILPFLDFEMADTLTVLQDAGFLVQFKAHGQPYGYIPTFNDHQRINGKEAKDDSPLPPPPGSIREAVGKHQGSAGDELVGQEGKGKGREQEKEQERMNAAFEQFWLDYPRKVSKDAARKEWLRRSPDAALVAVILGALAVHKASQQWTKDGGEFIPHPRTWLHQGRWQDDVTAARVAPAVAKARGSWTEWVCPHEPECSDRGRCAQADVLGRPRKAGVA